MHLPTCILLYLYKLTFYLDTPPSTPPHPPPQLIVPTLLRIAQKGLCVLCSGECCGGQTGLIIRGLILQALKTSVSMECRANGGIQHFSLSVWIQVRTIDLEY